MHVLEDCYMLQNKNKVIEDQKGNKLIDSDQVSVVANEYSDCEVLVVFYGDSNLYKEWVLNSSWTFHIFPKGIHNTKAILNYVLSNLLGPSKVPSYGSPNYMLTIIDDFSREFDLSFWSLRVIYLQRLRSGRL